jgi:CHASE2 domain-containing sensor protein/class 3 adenylate cyclase
MQNNNQQERRRNRRDDLITMVFTDLVNSTAIKSYLDGHDNESRNLIYLDTILTPHRQRVENNLASYRGRVIKTEGDAYFLIFANAAIAIQWAINLLISHQTNPISTPLGPLQVRIGMHTGSPLHHGSDFIGQEVDYAARISALANGNQILLSEVTEVLARNSNLINFKVYNHGEHYLKGIGKVPVFEVLYNNQSPQPIRDHRVSKLEQKSLWYRLGYLGLNSAFVTTLIMIMRLLGILQPVELWMFDRLIQLQPKTISEQPILLVKVTEADLKKYQQYPLSDQLLLEILKKLDQHDPIAIGLDIYRDLPVEPGHQEFANYLENNSRIVTICEIGNPDSDQPDTIGVAAPPKSLPENTGFSDLVYDPDRVIRRHLFYTESLSSACQADYALSAELALRYLNKITTTLEAYSGDELQLGQVKVRIRPLENHQGFYHKIDAKGYQILLNLSATTLKNTVTITDVLNDKVPPELIKNHLILIGITAPSVPDHFNIPDDLKFQGIAGVELHSKILNYWLNMAQGKTPLLQFWPQWFDAILIFWWSLLSGIISLLISHSLGKKIAIITTIILLSLSNIWLLNLGIIAPFIPSLLSLLMTISLVFYLNKISKI